jgi:hypothetical protein
LRALVDDRKGLNPVASPKNLEARRSEVVAGSRKDLDVVLDNKEGGQGYGKPQGLSKSPGIAMPMRINLHEAQHDDVVKIPPACRENE